MCKIALVTGITGQDGAYLADFLIKTGYRVIGTYRRTSSPNFWRLRELGLDTHERLKLIQMDVTDLGSILTTISYHKPTEIYNLAAQSFVGVSFEQPSLTTHVTALGTLNLLEAIRTVDKDIKFYQASTSEMYGKVQSVPQTEHTPFYPRSPYGVAKLYAHWITVNYAESYNVFASSGILFNHESPLRGEEFVTRKITRSVAMIKSGSDECIILGNLDSMRDWGFAPEYVKGMWSMLQHTQPDTFVLATNKATSVRDFVTKAFNAVDIDIEFTGHGVDEVAFEKVTGRVLVRVNKEFFRPAEVDALLGDASHAKQQLGWEPKIQIGELCEIMVKADLDRIKANK